jgi:diketogulonate reductase-like aldo/keto reductase
VIDTNGSPERSPYERKFEEFIELLNLKAEDVLLLHNPEALGDTYEEVIESLNRIADAEKKLVIVPRAERK